MFLLTKLDLKNWSNNEIYRLVCNLVYHLIYWSEQSLVQ